MTFNHSAAARAARKLTETQRIAMLDVLDVIYRESDTRERLANRLALHRRIAECAEGGKVLLVESGMDCDGVQYWGKTCLIEASVAAFDRHYDEVAKWADGSFSIAIHSPSERARYKYASRDRTLEAFENGHPWSI